ncbi:hypothetical protein G7Y89_g5491 [Cudoniella acicularis]|uniref:Uncharacterized protein n=1 Tax=Cudoniella acicularis TaxID=354080 RepID=A0A8H4RNY0_9HELO|nr:hypothetical protein G7Y89_g5491 [Cudoniella acicularis]
MKFSTSTILALSLAVGTNAITFPSFSSIFASKSHHAKHAEKAIEVSYEPFEDFQYPSSSYTVGYCCLNKRQIDPTHIVGFQCENAEENMWKPFFWCSREEQEAYCCQPNKKGLDKMNRNCVATTAWEDDGENDDDPFGATKSNIEKKVKHIAEEIEEVMEMEKLNVKSKFDL